MSVERAEEPAVVVVSNRRAGSIEGLDTALAALRKGSRPVVAVDLGDGGDLERSLDALHVGTVVAAGGDGTLNLLAQHLWRRGLLAETPIGLLPLGTGNDFARAAGIPLQADAAAGVVLAGRPRPFDLLVDDAGTVAVNAVHCGVGGVAVRHAAPLKPVLGRVAYRVGAAWAGARELGWRVRVELDAQVLVDGNVLFVGIGNGPTIGGGTVVWPGARPDDGLAEVVVAGASGISSRLRLAAALRSRDLAEVEGVVSARGRKLRVLGQPIPYVVDGEAGGSSARRSWQLEPAAWRLLVPAGDA
ncbi:MAG: lipid kinase [Actinobacteria bacterium]|nr:lipid kinase [Actinomycetota bacterium]MBW3651093.1 lipid kinase [Actinomycetota bacterium]